ncbi:MAG: aminotransferase class IV [Flavobacteriales bacterium]|nr:aminotransferase class IV [Flavobacteriales bacterium]
MSNYLLFNGEFHEDGDALLQLSNRGFCYGDGFFESMRISNGKVLFVKGHWNRLSRVCNFLRIQIPVTLTEQSFNEYALALAHRNGLKNARIRFQGYRMGEGRYAPESNLLGWSMVCQELETSAYTLNKNGLHVAFCNTHTINPAPQSSFKSSNSLPYVMASMFVADNKLDDCFLLDPKGYVSEATGSNVFLLKENELLTPNLFYGGVPGVMRSVVLKEAALLGWRTTEALISKNDILAADECFLTNAARGIQWVGAVEKKRFYKRGAEKLTAHINSKYGLLS